MLTETQEILQKVRKIEIKTRRMTNQVFSGHYHSAFKGRGMAFSEVREYQFGDDIRSIDWNVTARFNHPYIKVFEEERELTVMLLIDVSNSNQFGTQSSFKADIITEIASVLAFSAIQNNDKVGVIFFTDMVEKFIAPAKGKSHILRIIRELITFKPKSKGTNLQEGLRYLTNVIKKQCTAFVLSDFNDQQFKESLQIAARKHDIAAIQIVDKAEMAIPDLGLLQVRDQESGSIKFVDTSDSKVRRAYENWYINHQKYVTQSFKSSGIDHVIVQTGGDSIKSLTQLFHLRERRF
jgi:uncharacterized protein (DUF58 family)